VDDFTLGWLAVRTRRSDGCGEMKLVMTLKVRDEDDVLEDNLRFHRTLGVDFFIVTDNGSVDRTPEILARYVTAGLAHVIRDETSELRAHEVRWGTEMAARRNRIRGGLGLPRRRGRVLVARERNPEAGPRADP
jgi:glycosyl transferase family 2